MKDMDGEPCVGIKGYGLTTSRLNLIHRQKECLLCSTSSKLPINVIYVIQGIHDL